MAGQHGGRRPGAGRPPRGSDPAASNRQPASYYPSAEDYLTAIVEGREPPDQLRIAAAKTLIAYQRARQRAPVPNVAPRDLQRRSQVADDRTVVEDFEKRAAEIRARHGRR